MPAHRPVTASAANSPPWTSLSTPGGADGTSAPGAKSTAREMSTVTANAPRERAPCVLRAPVMPGPSEAVEVRLAVRADDREAGVPGEQVGTDGPDLLLVHGVQPGQHVPHRQVFRVRQLALAQPAHPRPGVLEPEHQAA